MDSSIVPRSGFAFGDLLRNVGNARAKTGQSSSFRSPLEPWSSCDDRLLVELALSGSSLPEIKQSLSYPRSDDAIRLRASRLNVSIKKPGHWSKKEDSLLIECANSGLTKRQTAKKLNRSYDAIGSRSQKLGIVFSHLELTPNQQQFVIDNYPTRGAQYVCKSLGIPAHKLNYFISVVRPDLEIKSPKSKGSAISRNCLPYNMVKRLAFLERECPNSVNKIQDSVVMFYDTKGMGTPVLAIHLDDLVTEIKKHLGVEYV